MKYRADGFEAIYEVDDGYVGSGSHSFYISEGDLEDDMTEDQLEDLFDVLMQEDFEKTISPYGKNRDEFITWAKDKIEAMKREDL